MKRQKYARKPNYGGKAVLKIYAAARRLTKRFPKASTDTA